MKLRTIFFILIITTILTSCSLLSPVKSEQVNHYEISAVPSIKRATYPRQGSILVARPETSTAYNTVQIAYTNKPYLLAYYSRNRWAETPAEMLHPLLIESLQDSNYFRAIVTPPFTGDYQYLLITQINKLQFNMLDRPTVYLNLRVQLIKISNNQIIATENINIQRQMENTSPYAGVYAANEATEQALRKIVNFCIRYAK